MPCHDICGCHKRQRQLLLGSEQKASRSSAPVPFWWRFHRSMAHLVDCGFSSGRNHLSSKAAMNHGTKEPGTSSQTIFLSRSSGLGRPPSLDEPSQPVPDDSPHDESRCVSTVCRPCGGALQAFGGWYPRLQFLPTPVPVESWSSPHVARKFTTPPHLTVFRSEPRCWGLSIACARRTPQARKRL